MDKVVILYSTTDGHTIKISNQIKAVLERADHEVNMLPISAANLDEVGDSDKIIIGASIRYGKHQKEVYDFVIKHKNILESKISAFFTVNVVARKANKNTPETNPYLKKFLSQVSWKPDELAVYAGKIDYKKYGVFDRMMIRFIMLITKGPTDLNSVVEFTDWDKVEEFGDVVSSAGANT